MKKVGIITGSRSEYGLLKPLIKRMIKSDQIDLQIFVTGTHLTELHNYTYKEIISDKIPITESILMYVHHSNQKTDLGNDMATAIKGFISAFNKHETDMIIVYGDRIESFAAATAAMCMGLPIAHISAGEVTENGQLDEQIRHAVTKMAHLHFTSTRRSAERLISMGEESWRVHWVGDPGIDNIKNIKFPSKQEILQSLNFERYILCVQHPVIHQSQIAGDQMRETISAIKAANFNAVIIHPNGDRGSDLIIAEIKKERDNLKFRIFNNLPREQYLTYLKYADVIVGNSSSGIAEAPVFNVPTVNIGIRESSRETGGIIFNVNHIKDDIRAALLAALKHTYPDKYSNIYVNESINSTDEITRIIEDAPIDNKLIIKRTII